MMDRYDAHGREKPSAMAAERFTQNLYAIQRNTEDPERWDVVRNAPTIVSVGLRKVEAESLAFALNVQARQMEGRE